MLSINEFPNTLTDYDLAFISELRKSLFFSNRVYSTSQLSEITITEMKGDGTADVDVCVFDMSANGSYLTESIEDVDLTTLNVLPVEEQLYKDYKSELKIIPVFVNCKLNLESNLLNLHLESVSDNPMDVVGEYSESTVFIVCPSTRTHVFYDPEREHPYVVDLEGETYYFDSLDLALKGVYEWAISECDFKPRELRSKIELLREYMDSDEGKASLQKMVKENEDKDRKNKEFYRSDLFMELIEILKERLPEDDGVIDDFLFDHGKGTDYLTAEEFFNLISSVFACADVQEDTEAVFTTLFVNIDGLRFEQMHGQGTVLSISLIEE